MTATAASFVLMTWSIRELAAFGPSEIVFLRSLFGMMLLLPVLRLPLRTLVRPPRLGLHVVRASLSFIGMVTWFYALQRAVLAEVVALQFTLPIFTTLLAIVFFKETVGLRRWMATVAGFAGALIIIRPGIEVVDFAAVLALLSAAFYAASNMAVKKLVETQPAQMVVFYMYAIVLPISLAIAIPSWVWPGWEDAPWIALLTLSGSTAHYCYSRALASAETSVVMPFDYLRLPLTAILGYLAYDQVVSGWTWVGAGVISAATIYIMRREAVLARGQLKAVEPAKADTRLTGG